MKQELSYRDSVHHMGRIWILGALAMLIAVPVAICIYYSAWPPIGGVMKVSQTEKYGSATAYLVVLRLLSS